METEQKSWNDRVKDIVRASNRRGAALFWLGFCVYGGGSTIILALLWRNPTIATALVMFLFQLCIMFFGTMKMYPKFDGGFWLQIEANRDTVPTFETISDTVKKFDKEKTVEVLQTTLAEVRDAVKGLQLNEFRIAFERKIDELKETIDDNFSADDPVDPVVMQQAREALARKGCNP